MSPGPEPPPAPAQKEKEAAAKPPSSSSSRERGGCIKLVKRVGVKAGGGAQQGRPSIYHAVVVIFLEFFAWGLLTTPVLTSLKNIRKDSTVLPIFVTVFLSYLPEAGQYSSFFVSLRQIIGFGSAGIAAFIAVLGIQSIVVQTVFLSILMKSIGNKNTVLLGLDFQIFQLAWYGFGSQSWMMWAAGAVAAMSSIMFPAISALVSRNAESDQQGVVQGIITGIRGLCNGLGPALYGFIFFLFDVELNELPPEQSSGKKAVHGPSDEKCGQQTERDDSAPLLHPGEDLT